MSEKSATYDVIEGYSVGRIKLLPRHVLIRWFSKTETKAGIVIPQTRERAHFMKGQLLSVGPDCGQLLKAGQLVEFNGLGQKEWLGSQSRADRDTVFFTRWENIYAIIHYDQGDTLRLEMCGEWVLVKPDEYPREKGNLLIPDQVRESAQRRRSGLTGVVRGCGADVETCIDDDHVIFDATGATQLRLGDHNGELCLIVRGEDILGRICDE